MSDAPPEEGRDEQELIATTGREHRRGSFGPGGAVGMPAERSENFTVVLRRLGEILGRERGKLFAVVALTFASVTLPKQLRETKIVKDATPDDIANEIVAWIKA